MTKLRSFQRITDRLWTTAQHPRARDHAIVAQIRENAANLPTDSDAQLASRCAALRERVLSGSPVTDLTVVIPCFALVYESIRRTLGYTLYDVQLLGGIVLSSGVIADIKTGEGKTLVTSLPASLYALTGRGVHVATVNRYLAERDFAQLKPVYERLGLTVGISAERASPSQKQAAYRCDITYATGYEFGFDYLRDQTRIRSQPKMELGQRFRSNLTGTTSTRFNTVQRKHAVIILDEADSVLIDEANTPLVLSGVKRAAPGTATPYHAARDLSRILVQGEHYVYQETSRRVFLTEVGKEAIFEIHPVPEQGLNRPWTVYIENALSADLIHTRDVDYVVRDGEIMIVDQYTGRIFADRTWRDGLHQAVEAKEDVAITAESASVARISRQRYFRFYDTICGLTGTALGLEDEFRFFYKIPVVLIPERVPCQRKELPTRYFGTQEQKYVAIVTEIRQRQATGQPILVGTRTIEESQRLSELLRRMLVSHRILNGMQDDSEADLIARAGEPGAVTIATNMAGRGTDIHVPTPSLQCGGLHVIATERQESQRIDRQLIGRSARQGNPGSCQFFVSAEDELLVTYGEDVAQQLTNTAGSSEDKADWSGPVRRVQRKAEKTRYEARCALFQQDQWLNDVLSTVAENDHIPGDETLSTANRCSASDHSVSVATNDA